MEISFVIIKENIKRFKPLVISLNSLLIGKEKEEIWALPSQSYITLKYLITKNNNSNKIENDNSIEKEIKKTSTDSMNNKHPGNTQKINAFLGMSPSHQGTRNIKSPLTESVGKVKSFLFGGLTNNNLQIPIDSNKPPQNINNNYPGQARPSGFNPSEKTPIIYKNLPGDNLPNQTRKTQLNLSYEIIENKELPSSTSSTLSETFLSSTLSDTFCQCIFISGITKDSKLIPSSEEFLSPCGHKECSMLPSLTPGLLNIYSNTKNVQHYPEITDLITGMCFPLGVKICYHCNFDKNKRICHIPKPQQTFYNIIKNEKEEIFYIATLQYFVKISKKEFEKNYPKYNTLQNFVNKISVHQSNKDKKFQEFFQILSHLMINDTVLIPESVSLISKYPFFAQMDSSLKCIISLPKTEMNNLITHIINEVPVPQYNYQINFYLPRTMEMQKLFNIKNNSENISNMNYGLLFEHFTLESIILIFHFILLEQKILFIDNNYKILSEISWTFTTLLYPFMWVNPYIPILSLTTAKFLQSFIPFIYGIDEYLFKYSDKNNYMNNNGDIIFIWIGKKYISLSKNRKKLSKKDILKELSIPDIPEKVYNFLYKNLKDIQKKYKPNTNKDEVNKAFKNMFIKLMIILIGDYKNFTFVTDEEMPLFNKEAFLNSHTQKDMRTFLDEMTETQIFNQFLFNEKISFNHNITQSMDIKPNLYSDSSYFLYMISKNPDLINTQQVRKRSSSSSKVSARNKSYSKSNGKGDNSLIHSHLNSSFHNQNLKTEHLIPNFSSKNYNVIQKFLLVPYFISNPVIYSKKEKIEEYITNYLKKKQFRDVNLVDQHCFIISNQKEYQFDQIKHTKIYLINNNSNNTNNNIAHSNTNSSVIKKSFSRESLHNKDSTSNCPTKIKKCVSLTQLRKKKIENKEIDDVQYLNNIFKLIITSKQKIKSTSFTKVESLLLKPSNREYLTYLIFPEYSISNEENHKQIAIQSYIDFVKIMKVTLSNLSDKENAIGRLLTLACFSYYKIDKEIIRYIYEDLIIGAYPCSLWIKEIFWEDFFEGEMNENNSRIEETFDYGENEVFDNLNNGIDEAIFTTADIMIRLNLNKNFVKKIICNSIASKHGIKEEKINEIRAIID